MAEPETVITRMTTQENERWLANRFLKAIVARYTGSVLGRQELEGELIEDLPGALWTRGMFRMDAASVPGRVVVAVDPPATGHERSDACGIVVAGRVGEDEAVVLADASFAPAAPDAWARRAVAAFHEHGADCIVAEVNQGGDMVRAVIAQVDADVPVREVRASRGKWVRAEPVAALYANGRVAHRPGLAGTRGRDVRLRRGRSGGWSFARPGGRAGLGADGVAARGERGRGCGWCRGGGRCPGEDGRDEDVGRWLAPNTKEQTCPTGSPASAGWWRLRNGNRAGRRR